MDHVILLKQHYNDTFFDFQSLQTGRRPITSITPPASSADDKVFVIIGGGKKYCKSIIDWLKFEKLNC